MLDIRITFLALIIVIIGCAASNKSDAQQESKAQQARVVGSNGCIKGMQPKTVDSLGWSACLPSGVQWQVVQGPLIDSRGVDIVLIIPHGSSPLSYESWNEKGAYENRYFNSLLEKHFDPESNVVLAIEVSIDKEADVISWKETREANISLRKTWYDLSRASKDSLDELDQMFRKGVLLGEYAHREETKTLITDHGVDWFYDLWVRKLEHSGQIRAGITAMNEHKDRNVVISTHWLRETLPDDLEEVRSDSMFVIMNQMVESFKWLD